MVSNLNRYGDSTGELYEVPVGVVVECRACVKLKSEATSDPFIEIGRKEGES